MVTTESEANKGITRPKVDHLKEKLERRVATFVSQFVSSSVGQSRNLDVAANEQKRQTNQSRQVVEDRVLRRSDCRLSLGRFVLDTWNGCPG